MLSTVKRITQTDHVSDRSIFCNSHCLHSFLYTHRYNRLKYRETSMRCSVSHTRNAEVSRPVLVINRLPLPTKLLMTRHIPPPAWTRTTVADRHKFSSVRRLSRKLLDRSKNAIFAYLTCIWRPRWGDAPNFTKIFGVGKLESLCAALFAWSCVQPPVLVGHRLVTNRQTYKLRATAYTALAKRCTRVMIKKLLLYFINFCRSPCVCVRASFLYNVHIVVQLQCSRKHVQQLKKRRMSRFWI